MQEPFFQVFAALILVKDLDESCNYINSLKILPFGVSIYRERVYQLVYKQEGDYL